MLVPATGHKDKDHDGRCDVCSVQLSQNLGDAIAVTWDSGSLGFGTKKYTFTCIDTDYNGTGKMLFIASEGVGSDLYGTYTTADSAALLAASAEITSLDADAAAAADVNGDDVADTNDAVLILQYAAEKVASF